VRRWKSAKARKAERVEMIKGEGEKVRMGVREKVRE
jgi:hypothetical protein